MADSGEHERRRVVITGMGALTPLAIGTEESWRALLEGRSGIAGITGFDTSDMRTRIAGEVKNFTIGDFDDRRFEKRYDRFINLAVAASRLALSDAGLDLSGKGAEGTGVVIGNALGGLLMLEKNFQLIKEGRGNRVSPFFVPGMLPSMASGLVAICLGARGPNIALNAACASGADAIGCGCRMIQNGEAERVLAGGTEAAITPLMFHGYTSMKATSARNDDPERASRPFDKDRDGFVPSEGAGILILEEMYSALRRDARIYAEIAGYGASCDAFHITAPDPGGDGPVRCMKNALADAGLDPSEIDCINAHGTSTPLNDVVETQAIKTVFREHSKKVAITANKSMIGHMIGATGAIEAIFSILSIRDGMIPPTVNHETPDPQCDLDYVPNRARKGDMRHILSNSFGFGGTNASLIFSRFSREVD
jgi:3-oxoacyl-[acyl-carrier-protein] synthase II